MPGQAAVFDLNLEHALPVLRICNQSFHEHARFPQMGANVVRYIRDYPGWQWGVAVEGRLAAFLLTEPRREPGKVLIRLIASDPGLQGRGLGGKLLARLEEKAAAEDYPLLSVGTPFASRFYEKYGFRLSKTDLKMIREITRQPVSAPANTEIRPLHPDNAAEVVKALPDDDSRADFLTAFFDNFQKNAGLMFTVGNMLNDRGPAGVVIARSSEFYSDFVEVVLYRDLGAGLNTLVRAAEYLVSRSGLRFVGFAPPAGQREELEGLGYGLSDRDYWWTMYTLERPLAGK